MTQKRLCSAKRNDYISAAEDSKSGGFNGRAASIPEFTLFEPEKVWAYEVGLRSEWFDQRLRFNATAYYSKDFQIQLNKSTTDPQTGLPVASTTSIKAEFSTTIATHRSSRRLPMDC